MGGYCAANPPPSGGILSLQINRWPAASEVLDVRKAMNCQSHLFRGQDPTLVTRRWFFEQCGVGLGAAALGLLFRQSGLAAPGTLNNPLAPRDPPFKPKAKRVIYLFMAGAPSHLELFDNKPELAKWDGK